MCKTRRPEVYRWWPGILCCKKKREERWDENKFFHASTDDPTREGAGPLLFRRPPITKCMTGQTQRREQRPAEKNESATKSPVTRGARLDAAISWEVSGSVVGLCAVARSHGELRARAQGRSIAPPDHPTVLY